MQISMNFRMQPQTCIVDASTWGTLSCKCCAHVYQLPANSSCTVRFKSSCTITCILLYLAALRAACCLIVKNTKAKIKYLLVGIAPAKKFLESAHKL